MSWFKLGWQEKRKLRKGVFLRVMFLSDDVKSAIKKSKCLRMTDRIHWIEISELRDDEQVLLEVWAQSLGDAMKMKSRYNVFHILIKENPEWICEGDQGRGFVESKSKKGG